MEERMQIDKLNMEQIPNPALIADLGMSLLYEEAVATQAQIRSFMTGTDKHA